MGPVALRGLMPTGPAVLRELMPTGSADLCVVVTEEAGTVAVGALIAIFSSKPSERDTKNKTSTMRKANRIHTFRRYILLFG
jgi:predicted aconitase with swiveling domain